MTGCTPATTIIGRREDQVDSYFWGRHPFAREFASKNGIPFLGTPGGPETTYPELLDKLSDPKAADAQAAAEPVPSSSALEQTSRPLDEAPQDVEIHVLPVQGISSCWQAMARTLLCR